LIQIVLFEYVVNDFNQKSIKSTKDEELPESSRGICSLQLIMICVFGAKYTLILTIQFVLECLPMANIVMISLLNSFLRDFLLFYFGFH